LFPFFIAGKLPGLTAATYLFDFLLKSPLFPSESSFLQAKNIQAKIYVLTIYLLLDSAYFER